MDAFQFYPTPKDLARRVWAKFKNRNFVRVLEPSAGNGDLALAHPDLELPHYRGRVTMPDCCEIDISKHAVLRDKELNVIGVDFLRLQSGVHFTHIAMNPPFSQGAKHVLKAWDLLWDGEISALINADTVRNPYSAERQLLVRLIEQNGEVEFIEGAFSVQDAERKTEVDVALVYLRKQANVGEDVIGSVLDELKRDTATSEELAGDYRESNELALPNSVIENSVAAFNAAVRTMREAVHAEARAQYYARLLGDTMAVRNSDITPPDTSSTVGYIREEVGKRYLEIKDRAWSAILRSTNVTSRLSSAAQKRVEAEFESIKHLEFTEESIHGFLCGIAGNQGKLQIEMMCDVFDLITKYKSDNAVFYKGWKSNDRHLTQARRVKMTRFILPGHRCYSSSMEWDSMRLLEDFDKAFALLDGKAKAQNGLADIFRDSFDDLRRGKRVSSDYFEARFFPGATTIHFFPRNKKLIARLNKLVGQHRQWLPSDGERVSDAFWLQYERAEEFDASIREEIGKQSKSRYRSDDPLYMLDSADDDYRKMAMAAVDGAITTVLERNGIDVNSMLEDKRDEEMPLLLAA